MKAFSILLLTFSGLYGKSIFFNPPLEKSESSISRSGPLRKAAFAARADDRWETFRPHGLGDNCRSLGLWKGDLVVAGDFKSADGVKATHAARWDGVRWQPLGNLSPVSVQGAKILPVGDSLFLELSFLDGFGTASLLAKWGGQDWIDIKSGLPTEWHYRLVEAGGGIYATGMGLFKWEGTWKALGNSPMGLFNDVEVVGGDLYVCGQFVLPGSADTVGFAKWSGSAWTPLAAPPGGDRSGALGLIQMGGVLHAVMSLIPNEKLMAKWEGGTWTSISGAALPLEAAGGYQESGGVLYVGGPVKGGTGFRIYRYDGMGFQADRDLHPREGFGFLKGINSFLFAGNTFYAGGTFSGFGNVRADKVARWDGDAWHALSERPPQAGPSGAPRAFHSIGKSLVVAGSFNFAGTKAVHGIATWDGGGWGGLGEGLVPLGSSDSRSYAVQTLESVDGDIFVGGKFDSLTCNDCRGLARWDGKVWRSLGQGVEGTVNAMAVASGELHIGGNITAIRGVPSPVEMPWVVRWNGSNLIPMGNGLPGPVLHLVSFKGVLHALSQSHNTDPGLYVWRGSWNQVSLPGLKIQSLSNAVEFGGELYISGRFETPSQERHYLIRWDGLRWAPVNALTGVPSLAADGASLFASGVSVNGTQGLTGIASWNGSVWTPVADLPASNVLSLHAHQGHLYVGLRQESNLGGKWAFGLARWSITPQSGIQLLKRGFSRQKPELTVSLQGFGIMGIRDMQGRRITGLPEQRGAAGIGVVDYAQ